MSRVLRPVACVIATTAVAIAIAAFVASIVARSRGVDVPGDLIAGVLFVFAVAVPASVGLFVALRQPGNRVAWILLVGPLSVAVVMAADAVATLALHHDRDSALGAWAAIVAQQWPVLFLWPLALAYVFPDGRLPSPRWRPVAALVCVACGGLRAAAAARPESESRVRRRSPNPMPRRRRPRESASRCSGSAGSGCWLSLFGGRRGAARPLQARATASCAARSCGSRTARCCSPLWLGGGSLVARLFGSDRRAVDVVGLMILQVWPAVAVAVAVTRHGLYAIDRLRQPHARLRRADGAAGRHLRARRAARRAGRGRLGARRRRSRTLAAALAFRPLRDRAPGARRPPLRARTLRGACGCCATSSTTCATAAPSRRTSAPRWRSRSATRAPRSSSGCPRPAPTRTATAT